MKKLIFPLVLLLSLSFISCGDDEAADNDDVTNFSGYITFTYDSADFEFTKGFTDSQQTGTPPLGSQDGSETNMYAMETAISFAEVGSISSAFFLTDVTLTAAGSGTATAVYYNDSGTPTAAQVTVTITTYGAVGAAIEGTFTGAPFTNGTFKVYNLGAE